MIYGAPIASVLAVLLSFAFARTRRGIIVPIAAWALLIVGAVMLALSFP